MPKQVPKQVIDDINAALERGAYVDRRSRSLEVRGRGGRVVLEGDVADIVAKRRAAGRARSLIAGEYELTDALRVSSEATPTGLADRIAARLLAEPMFRGYGLYKERQGQLETLRRQDALHGELKISVSGSSVGLFGRVPSHSHWRMAEVLCWWSRGCERVDNHLRVDPGRKDSDAEIETLARIVLEMDPLVNPEHLRIRSRAGVVHLEGFTATAEERQVAMLDISCIPGLKDVIDEIQTAH